MTTSPVPTLRCLTCNYDIASLIKQRGRDESGVCPECGADLRESNLERILPGVRIQHEWNTLSYLRWWWLSLVRPRSLAVIGSVNHAGRVVRYNCRVAAALILLLALPASYFLAIDSWNFADAFIVAYLVSIGVAGTVYLASLLVWLIIAAAMRIRYHRDKDRLLRNRFALDVATCWFVIWGLTIPIAFCVPPAAMILGWDRPHFGDFWTFLAAIGVLVPFLVVLWHGRVTSTPASKPPVPATLR